MNYKLMQLLVGVVGIVLSVIFNYQFTLAFCIGISFVRLLDLISEDWEFKEDSNG